MAVIELMKKINIYLFALDEYISEKVDESSIIFSAIASFIRLIINPVFWMIIVGLWILTRLIF